MNRKNITIKEMFLVFSDILSCEIKEGENEEQEMSETEEEWDEQDEREGRRMYVAVRRESFF